MRIYRTSTQMVPYDPLEEAAAQLAGYEVHSVLDDEGNEPPPLARLVEVDEAREAVLLTVQRANGIHIDGHDLLDRKAVYQTMAKLLTPQKQGRRQ